VTRGKRQNLLGWVAGALLLGLAASPAVAAGIETTHKVELRAGTKSVRVLQKFVPTTKGWDVHLIAEGSATGSKTAAIMRANGTVEFFGGANQTSWWKSFFNANGIAADATVISRKAAGRKFADLIVNGTGGSHYIGTAYFDPDNPWGPCPGPDDAPLCRPEPVIIVLPCKYDVDQCSGGPLPWPDVYGIDPDGDPAINLYGNIDPDGEPARGLSLLRLSLDGAVVTAGRGDLGTTILSMDGGRWFDHKAPGF